jgi:hypothetical protein
MNPKQVGLSIVLVGFAALNAYCFYTFGTAGFLHAALANAATVAVFIDLLIALTMVAVWMGSATLRNVVRPFSRFCS